MRHHPLTLGLCAAMVLVPACSESDSTTKAGGIEWPADRSQHEQIATASADMVIQEVTQRAADQKVDPLTLTVWDAAYDAVDARLNDSYGLTVNHSLDDQDTNGLVDDTTPTISIFFMQQSDTPKEQCEAEIDIVAATSTATCTAL